MDTLNSELPELRVDYPDGRSPCMVRNEGQVQSLTRIQNT